MPGGQVIAEMGKNTFNLCPLNAGVTYSKEIFSSLE